jgi:hypothetical protein
MFSELNTGRLQVRRSERHLSAHPMQGDQIRALRRLQCEQDASPYVFPSERAVPFGAYVTTELWDRGNHSRQRVHFVRVFMSSSHQFCRRRPAQARLAC